MRELYRQGLELCVFSTTAADPLLHAWRWSVAFSGLPPFALCEHLLEAHRKGQGVSVTFLASEARPYAASIRPPRVCYNFR